MFPDVSEDRINSPNHDIGVYVMTHGPICYHLPGDYCIPFEIGAEFRENFKYTMRDNMGENHISEKDKLYCELTGLYWMWKNDTHDYVGLYHYRRTFNITSNKIHRLLSKYDWIVPIVTNTTPHTVESLYCDGHVRDDWVILKDVLKELYPEYYKSAETFFAGHSMYHCNMFVTTSKKFDRYCEWLFPLLEVIEAKINLNDGRPEYNKRAIGFMAERLFSLYLYHNKYKLKEVMIYPVAPYHPLVSILPSKLSKFIESKPSIYQGVLYTQHRVYYSLLKLFPVATRNLRKKIE